MQFSIYKLYLNKVLLAQKKNYFINYFITLPLHNSQYEYYILITRLTPVVFHPYFLLQTSHLDLLPGIPFFLHFHCMDSIHFSRPSYQKASSATLANLDIPLYCTTQFITYFPQTVSFILVLKMLLKL